MKSGRNNIIDVLKGLGMLLVYLGHSFIFGKINFENSTFCTEYIHSTIYSFHMPLFFIISGYLANNKREINIKLFYKNKLKRLFLPYLVVNFMDFFPRKIFPNLVNSNFECLFGVIFNGTKISWFIYVLFIMFLIFPILKEHIFDKDKFYIFIIVLLGINYFNIFSGIKIFALNKVFYYLLYFYIGYIFKSKKDNFDVVFKNKLFYSLIAIVFFIYSYRVFQKNIFTMVFFAIIGSVLLLNIAKKIPSNSKLYKILEYIGENSLGFYLLEGFVAVIFRVVLLKFISTNNIYTLIITFFLLKIIIVYIIIKYILSRSSVLALLFGLRTRRNI